MDTPSYEKKEKKSKKTPEAEKPEKTKQEKQVEKWSVATLLVHGDDGIEHSPDLAPPIHVATTFHSGNKEGLVYSRAHSASRSRLEKILGELEGGFAITFSSGSAAVLAILMHYRPTNVWVRDGYPGTRDTIQQYLKIRHAGPNSSSFLKRMSEDAKFEEGDIVWVETPKNPTADIEDIAMWSKLTQASKSILVVDSTFATPILQRPLDLGADVVLHSSTKFICGQSDCLSGVVVVKNSGVGFVISSERTKTGAILGSLENFLLLRSLRTLELRVKRQSENATKLAKFLSKTNKISKVHHPSLSSHPQHKLCKTQMLAYPPILSFQLENFEAVPVLLKNLKLITDATSLGGVHSTIDWRYKYDPSLDPGLLRFSVGIEGVKDLMNDLTQALAVCPEAPEKPEKVVEKKPEKVAEKKTDK